MNHLLTINRCPSLSKLITKLNIAQDNCLFFFCVPCRFRMWALQALYNVQYFISFSNVCFCLFFFGNLSYSSVLPTVQKARQVDNPLHSFHLTLTMSRECRILQEFLPHYVPMKFNCLTLILSMSVFLFFFVSIFLKTFSLFSCSVYGILNILL